MRRPRGSAAAVVLTIAAALVLSGCGARIEVSVDVPGYEKPSPSIDPRILEGLQGVGPNYFPDRPFDIDPGVPDPEVVPPPSPPARSFAGWTAAPDGTLARVVLTSPGGSSRMVSLVLEGGHGRVVSAADTSVFMSRRDLTSWRLTRTELATALGALDAVGVRTADPGEFGEEAGADSAAVFFEPGRVIGGTDAGFVDTVKAVVEPPERGVRAWTPAAIGFLAGPPDRTGRSPLGPDDPFRAWPLRRGIRELAFGEAENPYGETELALCLRGRAAATVWRELFTGENTAYLRVDDGRRWELTASVSLPGYVLYGSPCDTATVRE